MRRSDLYGATRGVPLWRLPTVLPRLQIQPAMLQGLRYIVEHGRGKSDPRKAEQRKEATRLLLAGVRQRRALTPHEKGWIIRTYRTLQGKPVVPKREQ